MRKLLKKRFVIISTVFILFFLAGILLIVKAEKAPFDEIELARKSILEAKKVNAVLYTDDLMRDADHLYDSALFTLRKQNDLLFLQRKYSKTREYAKKSSQKAIEAKKLTLLKSKNLKIYVQIKIDSVEFYVEEYQILFKQLPLNKELFEHFATGNMLLAESKFAYKNKNYKISEIKIDKAYHHLNLAFTTAKNTLDKYFKNYDTWIAWTDEAIAKSKKEKSKAIIIDKFSKKMYLYKNGKLSFTTEIELGKNWIGDKNYSGDKTTPEGKYSIVRKKQKPQTIYNKALLIDYPNADDIQRFNLAKREGTISKSAQIGGLIEIHGCGGKGTNWTEGCVALHDSDMNTIFKLADVGTSVVIVGSLLQLSEIYN